MADRASWESSMMESTVTSFSVMILSSPLSWRMHDTLLQHVWEDRRSRVEGRLTMARGDTAAPLSHSMILPTLMMAVSRRPGDETRRFISNLAGAAAGVALPAGRGTACGLAPAGRNCCQ